MEEEELSSSNIMSEEEVENLFTDDNDLPAEDVGDEYEEEDLESEGITEVPDENLESESVGSEEDTEEDSQDDTTSRRSGSPNNVYSSLAKALREDGVISDYSDEIIDSIKTPEDFRALLDDQLDSELTERQQRIEEALSAGVEPDTIKTYEDTLQFIATVTEDDITSETPEGENLRQNIIYQDYINRGYSRDKALREVSKSMSAGTDIEDAAEALQANWEYFNNNYNNLIAERNKYYENISQQQQDQLADLEHSILDSDYVFDDMSLDEKTRWEIYNNIVNPEYTDANTGESYTALQRYQIENPVDYMKNVSLFYTLTDGFTNIDKLVKSKVRREMNRGIRDLEDKLSNTYRNSDGSIDFLSGSDDSESYYSNWNYDV